MPDLFEIQAKFQKAILSQHSSAPEFIISTKQVSADERMGIYGDAYRWRLVEALESNYPMFMHYVGEETFSELALEYIDAYPSTYRSVRWFGDRFAEFIAEEYSENTFMIELAQLEWVFSLVFDAPDASILSVDDFSKIEADKWPELCLTMHPSVHRLYFHWNVVEIWESLMNEAECPEPKRCSSAEAWIFWRKDLDISFCSMTPVEAQIFDLAHEGESWQTLCESLLSSMSEEKVPQFIAPLLGRWLQSGLIAA